MYASMYILNASNILGIVYRPIYIYGVSLSGNVLFSSLEVKFLKTYFAFTIQSLR